MSAEYLKQDSYIGAIDYAVFLIMILGSTLVGFYFGYWRKDEIVDKSALEKQEGRKNFDSEALDEYFVGAAALKPFPVGMTLVGSYISAVTILGTPAEMYLFGTQQMLVVVSIALSSLVVAYFFMPVFLNLQLASSYQYLEIRFNKTIRSLASILFVIDNILFLPVTLYVPVIAFEMFTGVHHMITTTCMVILVVLYTTLGGVKVVVYTDTWQVWVMFVSVVFAVIVATFESGGLVEVVNTNHEGGRWIFFNLSFSLYERYTLWSVVIGNFCYWVAFNSVNQTMVQRYMSLPSINKAKLAIAYFAIAMILFETVIYFGGVAMYSYFYKCDPLRTGHTAKADHLFPKFVLYAIGWMKGLPGFFLSGVFGATLSSVSVILNSVALVIYNDILRGIFKVEFSERNSEIFVKATCVVFGIIGLVLVPVINMLDTVFAVAIGLTAICNSTVFGLFAIGLFIPFANVYGAFAAAIVSCFFTTLSTIGTHVTLQRGLTVNPTLEMSNEYCPEKNMTDPPNPDVSELWPFFRLSYLWVNLIGVLSSLATGAIISLITGPSKAKDFDAAVFSPIIHSCLPDECFENSIITRKKKSEE